MPVLVHGASDETTTTTISIFLLTILRKSRQGALNVTVRERNALEDVVSTRAFTKCRRSVAGASTKNDLNNYYSIVPKGEWLADSTPRQWMLDFLEAAASPLIIIIIIQNDGDGNNKETSTTTTTQKQQGTLATANLTQPQQATNDNNDKECTFFRAKDLWMQPCWMKCSTVCFKKQKQTRQQRQQQY